MKDKDTSISRTARDRALVHRFCTGDEGAFEELINLYREKVYATAYRFVGNHEEADDLSQEVFIRVYRSLRKFRGDSSFYTWLYRIIINLCINYVKKRARYAKVPLEDVSGVMADPSDDPEKHMRNLAIRDRLNEGISLLPSKQRLIFILHQFDGLAHREIAEMLNKSEGGVKANYFHAVHKLRDHMKEFL
jgi:RNA polymerase sigma-70 factor (ECF subfamily)